MPQTDVPGEKTAKTQPFPTKPPAFDVQGITHDDLIDFTPELRAEAIKAIENYRIGPLYTPPSAGHADEPRHHRRSRLRRRRELALGRGRSGDRLRLRRRRSRIRRSSGLNKNDPAQTKIDADYTMGGGAPQLQWPAADEAAVRPHHRLQHEQGRHRVA